MSNPTVPHAARRLAEGGNACPIGVFFTYEIAIILVYYQIWFRGVVGYHFCLTHRRSPVRTRAKSIYFGFLILKIRMSCKAQCTSVRSFLFLFLTCFLENNNEFRCLSSDRLL
ncbi:hypothetical protein BGX38DRAFT_1257642, partial [Terfezia claveryi]